MANDDNTGVKVALGAAALLGIAALGVVLTRDSTPRVPEVTTPTIAAPANKNAEKPAKTKAVAPALAETDYTLTASGLGVHELKPGTGDAPADASIVEVHYVGWVEGGPQFFSTRERKKALKWPLGQSPIKGIDEALASMKKGGHVVLRVPPELAYGQRRRGKIPPGATLIIDVELIDIGVPRVPPQTAPVVADSDWTVQESGLKIHDIVVGDGPKPTKGQQVSVEYSGWIVGGERFDSSYSKLGPIGFSVGTGEVIAGWDEGVADMTLGSKRVLWVPYKLAYGEAGRMPLIPPKSDLIFEIELVSVE